MASKLKTRQASVSPSTNTETLLSLLKSHHFTDLGLIFDSPQIIHADVSNGTLGIGYEVFINVLMELKEGWHEWWREDDASVMLLLGDGEEQTKAPKDDLSSSDDSLTEENNLSRYMLHPLTQSFWKSRLWLLLYGDDYNQWNWRRRFFVRSGIFAKRHGSQLVVSVEDTKEQHGIGASNDRARIPLPYHQLLVDDELRFIDLVLSKHVKSEEAWTYRKWLLQHACCNQLTYSYEHELLVAKQGFERYYRNYYSWNFRYFVVEQEYLVVRVTSAGESSGDEKIDSTTARTLLHAQSSVIFDELDHMFEFLRKNISDYTAVNHINRVCNLFHGEMCRLKRSATHMSTVAELVSLFLGRFFKIFLLNTFLISFYPGHEALWLQRRSLEHFLFTHILDDSLEMEGFTLNVAAHFDEVRRQMEQSFKLDSLYQYNSEFSLREEISFVECIQKDTSMDDYEKQTEFAWTYLVWLCKMLLREQRTDSDVKCSLTVHQVEFILSGLNENQEVEESTQHDNQTTTVLLSNLHGHLEQLCTLLRKSKGRGKNLPEEAQTIVHHLQRHRFTLYKTRGVDS
uniref:Uncharacterized protein n=1 Tax=Percolomonas cosmopolitus TaxID=63605 RepID=A0A7S1PFE9_9EUKA|mmetsp:Transcript_3488/g.13304  ORF Transcript_3488/g.13304 Transcript_3488/m.13304 type:complete len:570 (+) Transcript_3488:273-1982(+)